ncbi:hypothetical protein PIB30_055300 [Stylosanthes scabra]|uniref:Uncharacterized protein n=1 Tax=Stylosanthes scabra TaxID=79078 RepID=A0ABU6YJ77_9FABA|nr:hypothetical protein [Stylosanthes scabra]
MAERSENRTQQHQPDQNTIKGTYCGLKRIGKYHSNTDNYTQNRVRYYPIDSSSTHTSHAQILAATLEKSNSSSVAAEQGLKATNSADEGKRVHRRRRDKRRLRSSGEAPFSPSFKTRYLPLPLLARTTSTEDSEVDDGSKKLDG